MAVNGLPPRDPQARTHEGRSVAEPPNSHFKSAVRYLINLSAQENSQDILRPEAVISMLDYLCAMMEAPQSERIRRDPGDAPEPQLLPSIFTEIVDKLDIEDHVRPLPDKELPKKLGRYGLVPLTARTYVKSYSSAGISFNMPPGVEVDNSGTASPVYLDASLAIGLTFKGVLRAVAAAYINHREDQLSIVQLQGTAGQYTGRKDRYKSGLYSGFDWRGTLVNALATTASELQLPTLSINGAINNYDISAAKYPGLVRGYDSVADRMGFDFDMQSGNWTIDPRQLAHPL